MFDSVDQWRIQAQNAMSNLESKLCEIRSLQAEAARLTAEAIQAYRWPDEFPVPLGADVFGAGEIDGVSYGEDLVLELACANSCSEASARYQVGDIARLVKDMPRCWAAVTSGRAPLWQARKVVSACEGLRPQLCQLVDIQVGPSLGLVGPARLLRLADAAVKKADPDGTRRVAKLHPRHVYTGADRLDPLIGWVSARLDRADAICLDATINQVAALLAGQDDDSDQDERRAKALGMLANPAAVIQLVGTPMPNGCGKAASLFTRKAHVYVHFHADTINDADQLARAEKIGPLLVDQVKQVTQAANIKLTPVIHVGGAGETVDSYEIPTRLREHMILREPYDVAPWSSIESRNCDLDHTIPFQPGQPGQTRPANLGPLSRRYHRAKTLAGWQLTQPAPGIFIWETPAGQTFQVDAQGTHRLPPTPPPRE
ncbi:MAG: 13E12 repeat family protein [Propionibacteriaceae bacterium]|nr:13E12 repeat family protein [Propionibacteriaceae bacterium]